MSFGFYAKNNNSQILFSDSSYVLEFAGKATLRTDIGYKGFSGYNYPDVPTDWRYYYYYGWIYDKPIWYNLGYYDIAGDADDIVAFSYVPVNDIFTGIVYQYQLNETTTRLHVITQCNTNIYNDPFAPQVYCFRKITPKADSGHGLKIYNAAGAETFTTQANVLIQKGGANLSVNASRLGPGTFYNLVYASNNFNVHEKNIQNHALINTPLSMSKPAISYYPPGTGLGYRGGYGIYELFELGMRYNNVDNILQSQWGSIGTVYLNNANQQKNIPAHQSFAMMIDGSDYD